MGKKLIIPCADFSANGFRVANFVDVRLKDGGTNPYKMYFLTNPIEMFWNANDLPTITSGAIEKSAIGDTEELLDGNYAGFSFGKSDQVLSAVIRSLKVDYDKVPVQCIGMCYAISADEVDLRGVSFAKDANMTGLFSHAAVKDLKMPDIYATTFRWAFYNFNNGNESLNLHTDFTFIKKATDLTGTFQYLKSKTADFSGIDVSEATIFNLAFAYCILEEIDLSTWHIDSATYAIEMFRNCSNLKTIHLDNFNSQPGQNSNMFAGTPLLEKVFVTNCSSTIKTWLLARLNGDSAGGSTNWSETTVDGKACLTHS